MARVLAQADGDWVLATVEGPRAVRAALRQSVPPAHIEHLADERVYRIRRSAWQTACAVFSRFELPVEWTDEVAEPASPRPPIAPATSTAPPATAVVEPAAQPEVETAIRVPDRRLGVPMQERTGQEFRVRVSSAGLTVEHEVDSETAWGILAAILQGDAGAAEARRAAGAGLTLR